MPQIHNPNLDDSINVYCDVCKENDAFESWINLLHPENGIKVACKKCGSIMGVLTPNIEANPAYLAIPDRGHKTDEKPSTPIAGEYPTGLSKWMGEDNLIAENYYKVLVKEIESKLNIKLPGSFKNIVRLEGVAEYHGINTTALFTDFLNKNTEFKSPEEYVKHRTESLHKLFKDREVG